MPNLIKKLVTAEYTPAFKNAGGMLIVSMAGLSVAEVEALRGTLDNGDMQFRMVKNSLARRVLIDTGYTFDDDVLLPLHRSVADRPDHLPANQLANMPHRPSPPSGVSATKTE